MPSQMTVAGTTVSDPFTELSEYGIRYGGTLAKYDLGGSGQADVLTTDEVTRTRIIASRISKVECAWFVERASSAPWSAVPADASMVDADPAESDGLYAAGIALYQHFRTAAPRGVAIAKIHKVLHLKRPALIPILDSRLLAAYATAAAEAARRHPHLGARRLNWAAIREDIIDESNARALADVRARLASDEDATVQVMAQLTDLRLLDAVAWRAG
ncbi:DUF6308 family protein [Isoptericola sp. S6320L]|uniref:DUF6308 family protein n=1 Tax=Isoptericola sp. S6320L TaxID=2926411 RepID=UPI001FF4087E|nr:DUF6308 family protein [Isoptericola sp. S6320L]MCK0115994.1 DUF6308 family protein [Isoptericola sp. S6320L]